VELINYLVPVLLLASFGAAHLWRRRQVKPVVAEAREAKADTTPEAQS
jgi:hypothetical protein